MIPGKKYTPEDILQIARRRWWLVALPLVPFGVGATLYARSLPTYWMSTAMISVVPQRIPESYVRSTVTIGPQDRLESIKRGILSRTRLEQIILEFNLYPDARRRLSMEDVVERMRAYDLSMAPVKGDAFIVSFTANDPRLAQRVTERVAGLFIDENIKQRATLAEASSEFLKSQLEETRKQLETTEKRLEEYRRAHAGELPGQAQANLQGATSARMQLQQLADSINRDRDRRLIVERQLADLNEPGSGGSDQSADGSVPSSGVLVELEQATTLLRSLEARYESKHPDVVHQRGIVAELEGKAKEELSRPATATPSARVSGSELARRNRVRELRAEAEGLDRAMATKQIEEARLNQLAAEYQRRLEAGPTRESELTALARDYETVSQQYKGLLANSKSAEMSEELERRQGGEQFRLVDPARIPERPVSPNRRRIVAMGVAAGLALGLALAGLLEYRDRSLRSEGDVFATLALPVVAVIPIMPTRDERRRRRRLALTLASATVVLVALAAGVGWRLLFHS
jgi:polysaccharide chain length determinant protein (PEP-CTERM system associated)